MSTESSSNTALFAEFTPPSYAEWVQATVASLQGRPFAKLISQTYEGIPLQPMYRQEDVAHLPLLESLPGQYPYVRGTRADGYLAAPWLVAQEVAFSSPQQVNDALRHDLAHGQTAVNLIPAQPTPTGLDPQLANSSLSLTSVADLATALAGIDLAKTPIFIRSGSGALVWGAMLLAYTRQGGQDTAVLRGSLEGDPLAEWVEGGVLPLPWEQAMAELALLVQETAVLSPHLNAITVHGYPYADGGANAVQELAFMLATAVAYLRDLTAHGLEVDTIAQGMQFAFNLGGDFFMEIAKLRAARLLWAQIVAAFGGGAEGQKMVQHGRTARYNKTRTDTAVNMLRVTTEAFAGALGGVDSLHVSPFETETGQTGEFSRRIARNVQIILQEEANLRQLIDPAGGSWYVEWLTDQVAQRAWALFQEVERQGGMVAAVQSGWVQGQVRETAVARAKNLATRKDVLVGTNLYANPEENLRLVIADLPEAIDTPPSPMPNAQFPTANFPALLTFATQGATMGQLTAALRADYPPTQPVIQPIRQHRAAAPFEQLRIAAQSAAERPRLFLATMGPLRQHKARADFARDFFAVGGFEIVYPAGLEGVETAVTAILADGATAVVICSTDDTYPDIVPPLTQQLKAANPEIVVILAGYPKEHVASFKAAGVDAFIYLGADCLAVNQWLQEKAMLT